MGSASQHFRPGPLSTQLALQTDLPADGEKHIAAPGWAGLVSKLWSSVLPQLLPGNRSALVSLTWITPHSVWGSCKTPHWVFHLAPHSGDPLTPMCCQSSPRKSCGMCPACHPTKLQPAPGIFCSLCLLYLPWESLHSPKREISKGTKDNRYEKLQVLLCREMIYWCWELQTLSEEKKNPEHSAMKQLDEEAIPAFDVVLSQIQS